MKNILEYDSLELSFDDKKILTGIYMKCETGQVVGLLGRNGCGKSSLMKVVFGSLHPHHKSVRINGKPLGNNYLNRKLISYLPQENLIPRFVTIGQALKLFEIDPASLIEVFPQVDEFRDLHPDQVSGGTLRLIETLIILNSPARFCILDEPFSGLMPLNIEKLIAVINHAKTTKGIIITDHMHRHVTSVADCLYVLANGKTYPVKNKAQLVDLGYLSSL
jgi:ABC-type multidrug transport system ATPase subunit